MQERMAGICFQSCLDFEDIDIQLDSCKEGRFFVKSAIAGNSRLLDIGIKMKRPVLPYRRACACVERHYSKAYRHRDYNTALCIGCQCGRGCGVQNHRKNRDDHNQKER